MSPCIVSELLARAHPDEANRGLELLVATVQMLPDKPVLHYRYPRNMLNKSQSSSVNGNPSKCVLDLDARTEALIGMDMHTREELYADSSSVNTRGAPARLQREEAPVLYQLFVRGLRFLIYCPQPEVRMRGHATLCRLFAAFSHRSRFRLLWDLLQTCPVASIRALLLDWLRRQVCAGVSVVGSCSQQH